MANDIVAQTVVKSRPEKFNLAVCMYVLFVYLVHESLNSFPVLRSVDYFNANVYSVAEERRQLSVEYVA